MDMTIAPIKTFAELKRRITVGTLMKLVAAPSMPGHKYLNVVRVCTKAQTNAVAFTVKDDRPLADLFAMKNGANGQSWLYWEKANKYRFTDNGFIVLDDNGNTELEYQFVEAA